MLTIDVNLRTRKRLIKTLKTHMYNMEYSVMDGKRKKKKDETALEALE